MTRAEPVALVKQTIEALIAIKSSEDEVLIIDNNHSNELLYRPLEQYCHKLDDSLNVRFYHKDAIKGYKAGALNFALSVMDDTCDYIVVVDSDYQALRWARQHIINAIQRYSDEALLQFPQYYRDSDKPDIHAELNHYFSQRLTRKINRSNTLSTGTFAVIKKEALVSVGGWCSNSITEDAHMGVLLHLKGLKTHYIPEVIATGVLPQTVPDLIAQRRRWIYGNMQVLTHYPKMLFSEWLGKPVPPKQADSIFEMSEPRNSKMRDDTALNLNLVRAHWSQLSAWVNFTGVFIGLQGACIATLIFARLFHKSNLAQPALKGLKSCYFAYAIFMGRRLNAYLLDSTPLKMPVGSFANNGDMLQNDLAYGRNASFQSMNKPINKFASNKDLRGNKNKTDSLKESSSSLSKLTGWLKRFSAKIVKPNHSESSSLKQNSLEASPLKQSRLKQSFIRQYASKQNPSKFDVSHYNKATVNTPVKKTGKVRAFIATLKKRMDRTELITTLKKQLNFKSTNRIVKNSSFQNSHIKNDERKASIEKGKPSPIISRLRAWLVHLSFWELGALSWLPVLWGQDKPFVCTPKFESLDMTGRSRLAAIAAMPKLLIGLNACTAILVWSYSPPLFVCAVSVLLIKLLASWLVISNFTGQADKQAPKSMRRLSLSKNQQYNLDKSIVVA